MTDPHISFRKPACIVEKDDTSWSGKYYIYLGHHFEKGHTCWVVGAYNILTDARAERHYNSMHGSDDPKAAALIYWAEIYPKFMRKPEDEEQAEFDRDMRAFFEREQQRRGIKKGENKVNIV